MKPIHKNKSVPGITPFPFGILWTHLESFQGQSCSKKHICNRNPTPVSKLIYALVIVRRINVFNSKPRMRTDFLNTGQLMQWNKSLTKYHRNIPRLLVILDRFTGEKNYKNNNNKNKQKTHAIMVDIYIYVTALLRAFDIGSYPATSEISLMEFVMSIFSLVKCIPWQTQLVTHARARAHSHSHTYTRVLHSHCFQQRKHCG